MHPGVPRWTDDQMPTQGALRRYAEDAPDAERDPDTPLRKLVTIDTRTPAFRMLLRYATRNRRA